MLTGAQSHEEMAFFNDLFNVIPGVGYVKGLVHDVCGDEDGAREAYAAANRTMNSIPIVGHVKGVVHEVCGDSKGADQAYRTATGSLNNIPVVGHVKSAVHLACGDEDKALEAYMAANRMTAVVGGALVAGPAGAVAAGALNDSVVTIATKKPAGVYRNVERIVEAEDAEDVFGGLGGMALDLGGDAMTGNTVNNVKKLAKRIN